MCVFLLVKFSNIYFVLKNVMLYSLFEAKPCLVLFFSEINALVHARVQRIFHSSQPKCTIWRMMQSQQSSVKTAQLFGTELLPRVDKIKQPSMQYSTDKHWWNKMGSFEQLIDFKHGFVIGCSICNETLHESSSLLDLSRWIVSANAGKWKCLGAT